MRYFAIIAALLGATQAQADAAACTFTEMRLLIEFDGTQFETEGADTVLARINYGDQSLQAVPLKMDDLFVFSTKGLAEREIMIMMWPNGAASLSLDNDGDRHTGMCFLSN